MNVSDLTGKVALITGAGRGIGRATALELARRGADVALVARSDADIDEVAAAVRALGRRALALRADLADGSAVGGVAPAVAQGLGSVAILVNNAGIVGPFGPLWELDPAEWERALRVNLVAPFLLAHAVVPGMRAAGWGRIVNVSSGAAQHPMERTGAYSTSKAGLDMLTRQLAVELAGTDVAVTAVYPGIVDTTMQASIRAQPAEVVGAATAEQFQRWQAEGALQSPDRPAQLIAALAAADDLSFTGHIVTIGDEEAQRLLAGHATASPGR